MNPISSFLFKSWTRCALTLVALGGVLCAVQQGLSRGHPPVAVVTIEPGPPLRVIRALPDPAAEAELPRQAAAVAPRESSAVLATANAAAPVSPTADSAPAPEAALAYTVPGQAVPPPLARAVPVGPSAALVRLNSSGTSATPRLDPPLAFTVDPKNLTPDQQTELASIQNQFLNAIGDANQNPDDPGYAQSWMTAQYLADQRYKAFFGWSAFEQMQLQRAMNSYGEIQ